MKQITFVVLALIISGCSALPESGTTESLAVNYLLAKATTQIIDGDYVRRDSVLGAVEDARQYVTQAESATVSTLYAGAMDRLAASGLDPVDKQLLGQILLNAKARLETAISARELDPDERVALLDALNWIEAAAR